MQGRPYSELGDRKGCALPLAEMGERGAVESKSGETVRQSVPALRRPTAPSTAGRKPAARPPIQFPPATNSHDDSRPREAAGSQRKTGRGAGQSPAIQSRRAAPGSFSRSAPSALTCPYALDDFQITALIQFFETLDLWDREFRNSNPNAFEVNP